MKQEHEYVLNASQTKTYPFLYDNLQQDFIFVKNKTSSFLLLFIKYFVVCFFFIYM